MRLVMPSATTPLTLYGAAGSGSVAVEAALTLIGIPYDLIEGATWAEEAARERVATRIRCARYRPSSCPAARS